MVRCLVCLRPLRTPEAQAAGVGSTCKKKIDPEALKELQAIRKEGFGARMIEGKRVIQVQILVDEDPPVT